MKNALMKQLFAGMLAVVMVLGLIGCTNSGESTATSSTAAAKTSEGSGGSEKKYNVVFIAKALSDPFSTWLSTSIEKIAKEKYPNIKVSTIDGQNAVDKQIAAMETAVSQKPDCIILQMVDSVAMVDPVKAARDAGIQTVMVNGAIDDNGANSTVDSNPEEQGKLMAAKAAELLPKNANIVIMDGPAGNWHSNGRRAGVKAALLDVRADVKVLAEKEANWNKDEGMALMEDWLQTFPKIDAVIAMNDNMALGALEAVKASGKTEGFTAYGVDGLADACLSIDAGELTASVVQDGYAQADAALKIVNDIVTGANTEVQLIDVPAVLITKDNVSEWLQKHKDNGFIK